MKRDIQSLIGPHTGIKSILSIHFNMLRVLQSLQLQLQSEKLVTSVFFRFLSQLKMLEAPYIV